MEITGTIKRVEEIKEISEKFKKREFVLEWAENPTYPQVSLFTLVNSNMNAIDKHKVGDTVKVHYNLKGRESNTKNGLAVFNTLEAWRIESVSSGTSTPATSTAKPAKQAVVATPASDDDLPF